MRKEFRCFTKEELHELQIDNILVEIKYSNNRTLEECILNILSHKIE